MSSPAPKRLREHPRQRFAGEGDVFDLKAVADELAAEPSGEHGHKQIALFKQGPATLALFLFEPDARLDNHRVDGAVIIHTLAGRLRVTANGKQHDLPEGSLLRLAPGVEHDVHAAEPSQMLLTISYEGGG